VLDGAAVVIGDNQPALRRAHRGMEQGSTPVSRPDEHRFTAELVPASDRKIMGRSGRDDREVAVAIRRDGQRFQTFVIIIARSLLKAAGADESDATSRAIALVMEPTIRQIIAEGAAPSPTAIELRFTDQAQLEELLRSSDERPPP
jgi:hypothetical protein